MAVISLIECTACGNLLVPGDIVGVISTGIFIGTGEDGSIGIQELPESQPVHYCATCSQEASDALTALSEAMAVAAVESALDDLLDEDEDDSDFEMMDDMVPGLDGDDEDPEDGYAAGSADTGTVCSNANFRGVGGPEGCCPVCAKPDRCCVGSPKPSYKGYTATKAQYIAAVESLDLKGHASDPDSDGSCTRGGCFFTDSIERELVRLNSLYAAQFGQAAFGQTC